MTQVVDAARRILRRPPDRKKPLAADQVMRIISRLEKGSLADVQVAVIFGRRPRGSQSGREKRRDKSFQAQVEKPLGTNSH